MWFGRKPAHQFGVPNHGHQLDAGRGEDQRSIVVARAATQPDAIVVDRECGNQYEVGGADRVHP